MKDLADPSHLLQRIIGVFPEFADCWEADHPGGAAHQQSMHSVYMSLFPFAHTLSATPKQIARFAALLNEAVAAGAVSENAVATCFLEHLGPSPLRKALWPLLHPATKQSAQP